MSTGIAASFVRSGKVRDLYALLPESRLRLHALDVGGSFGQRSAVYPEYAALMIAVRGERIS